MLGFIGAPLALLGGEKLGAVSFPRATIHKLDDSRPALERRNSTIDLRV